MNMGKKGSRANSMMKDDSKMIVSPEDRINPLEKQYSVMNLVNKVDDIEDKQRRMLTRDSDDTSSVCSLPSIDSARRLPIDYYKKDGS